MNLVINASPLIFLSKIDKAARNCAASMQINVVGTIGLIIIAKRRKVITDAKGYLEKLKNTGFRISDQLFDHAIKLANQ